MPIYEYAHQDAGCTLGKIFEVRQSVSDAPLSRCPHCGRAVKRLISRTYFRASKSNSELKDSGFTKLVRRDDGVYENVTARNGERRVMHADKPETYPDLKKTLGD